jgi:hypothetical protein
MKKQVIFLLLILMYIGVCSAVAEEALLPEEKTDQYMSAVRSCLDNLLEHGTDTYGPVHTPMLMSIIDVRTDKPPRELEVLDGMIRSEGRMHRLNPNGTDLWDDQPLIRTMYAVSEVSKDAKYAKGADAYIKSYFERAQKPNGLLAWGSHIYYDAIKDKPGGDGEGTGPHETLVLCPSWDRMYAVAPEGVTREIENTWEWHVVDKKTGLHNRHDNKQRGCDFAFSGGEFGNAFAFLHAKTGKQKYMDWSKIVFLRHWNARNMQTNLTPDAPGTGDRYDANHCFTTLSGPHSALLLKAYESTGDEWFKFVALGHIKAWNTYAWDAEAQQFHGMLTLDGTPIPEQKRDDSSYDVWKPTGYVDAWRATMYSYEFPLLAGLTAVYAYELTKDDVALQTAQNWGTHIRKQLPVSNGRRWGADIEKALPDAKAKGGGYAENYGRAISFFLRLYRTTNNKDDFDTAVALADESIEKLYENGWLKGHPASPYYRSVDGVAYLMYALLELAEYPNVLPVNL